jgi:predicted secreted hydrolase
MQIDDNTKRNIAAALWQEDLDINELDAATVEKIGSEKNSNQELGKRMRHYIQWLADHPQSHNPNYKKRYKILHDSIGSMNIHQAYVTAMKFMGQNATQGFEPMPTKANLQFPRDHEPKLHSQVGWHFFVGSAQADDGQEYGIEMMFFQIALLPPNVAKALGISDIENQVVELQLGIAKAGERHYQAEPVVIGGTTGLIQTQTDPLLFKVGKNEIRAHKKGSFFPLHLKAHGYDRGEDTPIELGLDIEFSSGKEYLRQGDNGCMPCVAGMGTLYYSIPNIALKSGSTLTYKGKKIKLKSGTFWFDHQWGFLTGNPHSAVLRAANNISKPAPVGWDWYMAQFVGDRQITMFSPHSAKYSKFYFQTGSTKPGSMKVDVAGKYMDEKKQLHIAWGTLVIDDWIKSQTSPNPKLYPITHTWHPNRWKFEFDATMPEDIRKFEMTQIVPEAQTNYFANGSQYNEGAVYLTDPQGNDIGRGFAEAVQYADTADNMVQLAGFGNSAAIYNLLYKTGASLPRRLYNLVYTATHQKALKQVLSSAAGLEFFSKPAKAINKTRHS